jgi:alanine racemase
MASATFSVDLSALKANYQILKKRHAKHHIASVVKANAYGLGMPEVSKALLSEGCHFFFVATLDEAIELRSILHTPEIAVFNGIMRGEEKEYDAYDIIPVINERSQFAYVTNQEPIVHFDSGMTRLGLSENDLTLMGKLPKCRMIISHLACANEPQHPKNGEQLSRLKKMLAHAPGVPVSFANSSGHFLPEYYHFDIGRPGCALYGINPTSGENPMKHVATLSAPILQLRELDRNETVGYGATAERPKGAKIAIVAMGYSDGYFRSLSNLGHAYIGNYKVPITGRISMDMIALDVSVVPDTILSAHPVEFINDAQRVDDVAQQAGTIGYEVFTRIGRRVKRVYSDL